MKYLIMGDLHLTDRAPERRTDADYFYTMYKKLSWILALSKKEKCLYILQPGDFFHSAKTSYFVVAKMVQCLSTYMCYNVMIKTVFGQHDLHYHNKATTNTPLNVLKEAHCVEIADAKDAHVYGVSWEEELPKQCRQKILMMHKMVSNVDEPFETARASNLLRTLSNFDLIVCGDNHKRFVEKIGTGSKARYLVNAGSLMRMTTAQLNHQPAVYIYNDNNKTLKEYLVPVRPIEEVFNLNELQQQQQRDERLEAFVSGLRDDIEIHGLDFVSNLKQYMKEKGVPKKIHDVIFNEVLVNE